MAKVIAEAAWIDSLPPDVRMRFLAKLSFEITIAGRNSYEPGTEELTTSSQLRRVNEVLHRVTACLSQSLEGSCPDGFVRSIAEIVLTGADEELRHLLHWSWANAKSYMQAR